MWNRFKTFDPLLFLIPVILMTISVTFIYALTVNTVGDNLYTRQAIYATISLILMMLTAFLDYRSFKGWWIWIYLAGVLGLLTVMVVGKSEFGARRWVEIGFFQLQPGELEKLIIIIALAALLAKRMPKLSYNRFILTLLVLFVPIILVLAEPDLGTAIVVTLTGLGMLFHARLTRGQKILLIGGIMVVITLSFLSFQNIQPFNALLKDYQKNRLASFIEPSRDPSGSGYNVLQSVITVGSGGLTGKGLGFGSQSQLNFLPVAHADFIFAGIAEGWGLLGSVGIITLYGLLFSRIIQAAKIAKDDFGLLICVGIMIKIMVEILINIGMNIRLMPVTGIPLPFLSYGGTTMITNALCLGLVQSIVMRFKRLTF